MNSAPFRYRAFWPIEDDTTPLRALVAAAELDLPGLYAQAHAVPAGRGEWRILPGDRVPGSGGWTGDLLMWEVPACRADDRKHPESAVVELAGGQWVSRGPVKVWVPEIHDTPQAVAS